MDPLCLPLAYMHVHVHVHPAGALILEVHVFTSITALRLSVFAPRLP